MSAAEQLNPGHHWLLTFTEPGQPPSSIIVGPAPGIADAVQMVSALGLAPKGQLDARVLPVLLADQIRAASGDRLLNGSEIEAIWEMLVPSGEYQPECIG